MSRRCVTQFLSFLRRIGRTHKTAEINGWIDKYPRFKLNFTPTSAFWMNLVERFFVEITTKRIRRGSHSSVDELEAASC